MELSVEQVEHVPAPESFSRAVELMTSYVRREEGAYSALVSAAREDPEAMTQSLIALGVVLLDISAGAFSLTPAEMILKVSATIRDNVDSSAG